MLVASLHSIAHYYGAQQVLQSVSFTISAGQKLGLIGPNGSGKTTILRLLLGEEAPSEGTVAVPKHVRVGYVPQYVAYREEDSVRIGPSQTIGYSAQEQEVLRDDRTIMEEIRATAVISAKAAFALLDRFLFGRDDTRKLIGDLSGGERNRLQLARLMVLKPNFLILDEPTNHLDIPASEAIEEALDHYDGTLLVVSHDRYFLDKVVDRVVEVRDHGLVSYPGNFSEFWHARKEERASVVGRVTKRGQYRANRPKKPRAPEDAAALEQRIQEAEQEKETLEGRLADAFTRRDRREGHRLQKQLDQINKVIDELYEKWMAMTAE